MVRNFKVYITSSLLSFLLIIGCNKSLDVVENNGNPNNGDNYYNISGQIRDSLNNFQLDSVYVSIPGDTAFLSRFGSFEIKNRTANTYHIYFNKTNYNSKLIQLNLNSDTSFVVLLSVKPDTVDYYPLMIGNSWVYNKVVGTTASKQIGTERWILMNISINSDNSINYLIESEVNGFYIDPFTNDTIGVLQDTSNFVINENNKAITIHYPLYWGSTEFDRFYNENSPDTINIEFNSPYNISGEINLKRGVGITYLYYFNGNTNTNPYGTFTLIDYSFK